MALAGHPLAIVQLFGRWGSTAVLGYVKDALLGVNGGTLAQLTEKTGAPLAALEEELVGRMASFPGMHPGDASALSDRALESLANRLAPLVLERIPLKRDLTQEIQNALAPALEDLNLDIKVAAGKAPPRFVKCSKWYHGKAHIALDDAFTLCSWKWAEAGATPLLACEWDDLAAEEMCKRCLSVQNGVACAGES